MDDATVVELMESCRAVCVLAEEDFGIVSVEAQAALNPVIACRDGGALETEDVGVTGVFFQRRDEGALIQAICASDEMTPDFSWLEVRAACVTREASCGCFEEVILNKARH